MSRNIYFILFDGAELLDIAGPAQAFHEANGYGAAYQLHYAALSPSIRTAQGLEIASLAPLPKVTKADWVFIPGYLLDKSQAALGIIAWLGEAAAAGARLCSICTGAFLLGYAGLLDGRSCTTHWKRINELRASFPKARILDNRLYVEDKNIISSAGISSGIDMSIYLIGEDLGFEMASIVAREMVMYLRRDGNQPQISAYLQFQDHLNASVHLVQQFLIRQPASEASLKELAQIAHISPRHLSRIFRHVTGISIGEFRLRLRLELASNLIQASELSIEEIATKSGFADARQLRRLWRKHFDMSPRNFRKQQRSL
jgi:transcriptional regulator GlxA family with amidase domain